MEWWASCCFGVQYKWRKLEVHTVLASSPSGLMATLSSMSKLNESWWRRYENGDGSCVVLATLKGSSASIVTTQGLTEVPTFLARKGPNGMYSHF